MAEREVDVLIIGGGLIGAALSISLSNSSYSTLLVDSKPQDIKLQADFDARSLALSPASVRILSMLQVWDDLLPFATPIETIHVSEQKRFGATRLVSNKGEALGYVVEMQHLHQVIQPRLQKENVLAPAELIHIDQTNSLATLKTNDYGEIKVKAKLIVAADGANSFVRQCLGIKAKVRDYQQSAVIANVGLARDHHFHAFERFAKSGPLALLPMSGQRCALVWSQPHQHAKKMLELSDDAFIKTLHQAIGYRLGRFTRIGRRNLFPLQQVTMKSQVAWPVVFIGNAAHTLHPIAGQGFNLGLRDVALLAQSLVHSGIELKTLETYQNMRAHDQTVITQLTHSLVALFTASFPGLSQARGCGLFALDNLPPLKKLLSRYAGGFGGTIPDLACQIPLVSEDT